MSKQDTIIKAGLGLSLAAAIAIMLQSPHQAAATVDASALVQPTNYYLSGSNIMPTTQQVHAANIVGNYALVDWYNGPNAGGELVLSNASGTWTIVYGTGGDLSAAEITSHAGVPASTAAALKSGMMPVSPALPTPTVAPQATWTNPPPYTLRVFRQTGPCYSEAVSDLFFPGDVDDFGHTVPAGYQYRDLITPQFKNCGPNPNAGVKTTPRNPGQRK